MDVTAARKIMVDSQVRVNDVTDRALQAAMLIVPREQFCAPERSHAAYAEVEVEIAGSRRLMQARDVGKLLQALGAREGEAALAIAAPYAGAVLAEMGLRVTVQEADLAVMAVVEPALSAAGVETVVAPFDAPGGSGFDILICEAAVTHRPDAWVAALREGGRMVLVERSGHGGKAVLYVRGREGVSRRELFDAAPPMLAEMAPAPVFAL
ncbi:MAG: protein-L-isoaspartate O-methyltransferase [Alphaproteobacteria bacterium]|nr:MAG: protein-L-isoaspartate O-methyltransferase [Alphaproteobacteria bacterium]PZO36095.1 MAG: protein-L-isoaspartate O-methyltransferase [Alphaproteobacteria bacterium]